MITISLRKRKMVKSQKFTAHLVQHGYFCAHYCDHIPKTITNDLDSATATNYRRHSAFRPKKTIGVQSGQKDRVLGEHNNAFRELDQFNRLVLMKWMTVAEGMAGRLRALGFHVKSWSGIQERKINMAFYCI